ncbi:MAG: hypothetical protein QGG73_03855 [Candidatus Hydrogenedentes bacterium]|nr:hypothetical protein [Candidatus Hydrogenedentota bacterium]
MSDSGVGKSKLIGMIARNANADVSVIARFRWWWPRPD